MPLSTRPPRRIGGLAVGTAAGRSAALVATLALVGALGCGGSDKSTGPGNLAGTYNVVSVTGPQGTDNTAPFVLVDVTFAGNSVRAEMPSGSLTLGTDGRYSSSGFVNVYVNGVIDPDRSGESFPSAGRYTQSGSSITFTPDDTSDPAITATFSGGNTISVTRTVSDATLGALTFSAQLKK